MSKKIIACAKCRQSAETDPRVRRSEYTKTYPIRSKDGIIYCWDCYKSISCCKVCNNSVANMKISAYDAESFPRVSGYSRNCERVENEVEFICSQKCSDKLRDKEYREWKEKLSQGWTKCIECIDLYNWLKEMSKDWGRINREKFLEEEGIFQSRLVSLVPPNEGKLCKRCKHNEEVEKPRKKEIRAEAQKHWDSLPYETRLSEVKRTGSVGWGNFYRSDLNAEGIAAQGEVPYGVVYEFELKDCHHDCKNCHLDEDFKNSSSNRATSLSCNGNEVEKLENELIEAKQQRKSTQEIERIKSELEKLNNQQKEETKSTKTNNDMLTWGIGIFLISALVLGVIILVGKNNKKKKIINIW